MSKPFWLCYFVRAVVSAWHPVISNLIKSTPFFSSPFLHPKERFAQQPLHGTTIVALCKWLGKRHLKNKTCLGVAICDFHILFAFYNVGMARYNWTGFRAIKLDTEN